MSRQGGFLKPQRATSMSQGGGKGSSGGLSSMDSPYSSSMLRPSGSAAGPPSYGAGGRTGGGGTAKKSAKEMATPELIRPSPGNPSRQSEPQTAMFNLLATIVGGGVLSLPYAFKLTGVFTGIVLMALAAMAGDFSLYMLCSCARRTGQITYVEVAQAAFGKPGALLTTSVLMVMTIFVMIAYMVLVRDIWAGIVSSVVGRILDVEQSNQVLFAALIVVFPACLAKDLHALRHFCYVGFFSTIILTATIGYRSLHANQIAPDAKLEMKLNADSWGDIFDAAPILCLAFQCHFNILSVHQQFVNPTRERLKGLLHGTMGLAAGLYVVIGVCGYFYAFNDTRASDDILLNFAPSDYVMIVGRVGMGLTMLVAITMLVLPCRDIVFTVMDSIADSILGCCGCRKDYLPVGKNGDVLTTPGGSPVARIGGSFLRATRHVATTVILMGFSLYCALSVPGVGVVWSICGSSVGFMICYLLPSVFYLKIRWHKPFNLRKAGAMTMMVFSVIAIVICTRHAVLQAL
ncbi:unnamed protein product [Pylaiella littoralis]